MTRNQVENVPTAFDLLLEAIEAEVEGLNTAGAESFESGRYEQVQETLARAEKLKAFRESVAALRDEWVSSIAGAHVPASQDAGQAGDGRTLRNLGKLRRGVRTPEPAFWVPILDVLVARGGQGPIGEVLDAVYRILKDRLNEHDHKPLASDPASFRWRNTAQWARSDLVKQGLLRNDSPRGIWAITDQGRTWLQQRKTSF